MLSLYVHGIRHDFSIIDEEWRLCLGHTLVPIPRCPAAKWSTRINVWGFCKCHHWHNRRCHDKMPFRFDGLGTRHMAYWLNGSKRFIITWFMPSSPESGMRLTNHLHYIIQAYCILSRQVTICRPPCSGGSWVAYPLPGCCWLILFDHLPQYPVGNAAPQCLHLGYCMACKLWTAVAFSLWKVHFLPSGNPMWSQLLTFWTVHTNLHCLSNMKYTPKCQRKFDWAGQKKVKQGDNNTDLDSHA